MSAEALRQVRRELDAAAEYIERLADEVEATGTGRVPPLVGVSEIAEITGMSPAAIKMRKRRRRLPSPVAELAMGAIWLRADIEHWWENER